MICSFSFTLPVQLWTVIVCMLICLSLSSRLLVSRKHCAYHASPGSRFPSLKPVTDDASLITWDAILKASCLPVQVSRPLSLPPSARDNLYHGLPITVKSALRSRLQTYNTEEEVCPFVQPRGARMFRFLSTSVFHVHVASKRSVKLTDGVPLLQRTVAQIKAEMQKTLRWLLPIAENTIRCADLVSSYSD